MTRAFRDESHHPAQEDVVAGVAQRSAHRGRLFRVPAGASQEFLEAALRVGDLLRGARGAEAHRVEGAGALAEIWEAAANKCLRFAGVASVADRRADHDRVVARDLSLGPLRRTR